MRQVIFDTETTGLNPREDRLVSFAALEMVDGALTGAFIHYHLNPERPCNPKAAEIHGLTDAYLVTQPRFVDVEGELNAFINADRLVIHNAKFDMGFLSAEIVRNRDPMKRWDPVTGLPPYTCTYEKAVAKRGIGKGRNTLDALAREWQVQNLRELTGKHGALVDCLVLFGVFRSLAGLEPSPLVQSQIDHYLNKGFGIHGNFEHTSAGGASVPAPASAHPASLPPDVRPVG